MEKPLFSIMAKISAGILLSHPCSRIIHINQKKNSEDNNNNNNDHGILNGLCVSRKKRRNHFPIFFLDFFLNVSPSPSSSATEFRKQTTPLLEP